MRRHFERKSPALSFISLLILIPVLTLLISSSAVAQMPGPDPSNERPSAAPSAPTILYNFSNGADGGHPGSGGLLYMNGKFYGTAIYAGDGNDDGVVFELSNPNKTAWIDTPIYTFCGGGPGASCNPFSGAAPTGGLATDGQGNLYGTTEMGGGISSTFGSGLLFELIPSNGGWTPNWLWSPCCTPTAGVTFDPQGNFYGTLGGGYCGETLSAYGSSVYEWSPSQGGFITLHTFCGENGASPASPLTIRGGNLYGTSSGGGDNGKGMVFELTHYYPKRGWDEWISYSFCALPNCSDGANPSGGLLFDGARNIYGTTLNGGANGKGTIFKLTPAPKKTWTESVLYSFCSQANCADGSYPQAGLIHDQYWNVYGTTCNSTLTVDNVGPAPYFDMTGTVFQLTPGGVLNVLANLPGCSLAPLTRVNNTLYGTISTGGTYGYGAAFAVKIPAN